MQRLENPKTSIVYRGAPTHIYICDTLPLDNLKTHLQPALPYITIVKKGYNRTLHYHKEPAGPYHKSPPY